VSWVSTSLGVKMMGVGEGVRSSPTPNWERKRVGEIAGGLSVGLKPDLMTHTGGRGRRPLTEIETSAFTGEVAKGSKNRGGVKKTVKNLPHPASSKKMKN